MHIDIERKFLVKGDFRKEATHCVRIKQGYLAVSHGISVRVRIMDTKGRLAIKSGYDDSGLIRNEWERTIPTDEAEKLLKICETRVIDKMRHYVPFEGHTWEVDEFYGENLGLLIAEIELVSVTDSFSKPDWLGEEVTGQKNYYNSFLAVNPYSTWRNT